MFGRSAMTLGIGPHFYFFIFHCRQSMVMFSLEIGA